VGTDSRDLEESDSAPNRSVGSRSGRPRAPVSAVAPSERWGPRERARATPRSSRRLSGRWSRLRSHRSGLDDHTSRTRTVFRPPLSIQTKIISELIRGSQISGAPDGQAPARVITTMSRDADRSSGESSTGEDSSDSAGAADERAAFRGEGVPAGGSEELTADREPSDGTSVPGARRTGLTAMSIPSIYKVRGKLDDEGATGVFGYGTATTGAGRGVHGRVDSAQGLEGGRLGTDGLARGQCRRRPRHRRFGDRSNARRRGLQRLRGGHRVRSRVQVRGHHRRLGIRSDVAGYRGLRPGDLRQWLQLRRVRPERLHGRTTESTARPTPRVDTASTRAVPSSSTGTPRRRE